MESNGKGGCSGRGREKVERKRKKNRGREGRMMNKMKKWREGKKEFIRNRRKGTEGIELERKDGKGKERGMGVTVKMKKLEKN